jgi:hypothetical protein
MARHLSGVVWVVLAVLVAVACPASAAPPSATLKTALAAARCELAYVCAHASEYNKLAPDPTVRAGRLAPGEAHLRVVSTGKPLAPTELRKAAWAMCEAFDGVGAPGLQHLIVDFYADDRLARPSSDRGNSQGVFDQDHEFKGETIRYILSERFVDTTQPVNWYARALWWRPWKMKDKGLVGMEPWQFDAWYAAGNATSRPAEGGADFAPAKVK